MSAIAPRLDDSLPTTPSHEWSQNAMSIAGLQSEPKSNNPYFNGTASGAAPSNYPVQQEQPIPTTTNAVPHVANPNDPTGPFGASSPEADVPGSYPRDADTGAPPGYSPSQVFSSGKQNAPESNRAPSALSSAGQTAKSYLPASLSGYLSGGKKASFPTSEAEGIKPGEHQDGVGSLPGTREEAGVAKLPEERSQSERPDLQWQDSQGEGAWGEGGLHKGDEKVVDKGLESVGAGVGAAGFAGTGAHDSEKRLTGNQQPPAMQPEGSKWRPTQETSIDPSDPSTFTAKSDGVRALSGRASEQAFPLSHDERNESGSQSQDLGIKNGGTQITKVGEHDERSADVKKSAPAPALPERAKPESTPSPEDSAADKAKAEEKKTAALKAANADKPDESSAKDSTDAKSATKGLPNKGVGYDTDYHPAALHPPPADTDQSAPSTTEADTVGRHGDQKGTGEKTQASSDPNPNTGESAVKEAAGGGPGTGHNDTEEGEKKKVGIMDKVKGEVQILVGKATHKEGKVEEGRKLKEGRTD